MLVQPLIYSRSLRPLQLGTVFRIYILIPATLISIGLTIPLGYLEHMNVLSIVFSSAGAALVCQIGYVVGSRLRSWIIGRKRR